MADPSPAAVNSVLYALSTIAQTCAALAALIGALALYRLQAMREAHEAQKLLIRDLSQTLPIFRGALNAPWEDVFYAARENAIVVPGLSEAVDEFEEHDDRYSRALNWFFAFEGWHIAAILASLLGFTCVSWLASHWWVFASLLVLSSFVTAGVTALALLSVARGYVPWADDLLDSIAAKIPRRFSRRWF